MTKDLLPSELGYVRAWVLYMLKYGRVKESEAARMLNCHRETIRRLCRENEISPKAARRAYLNRLLERAQRTR